MRAAERTRTVVTGGAVARRVGTVGLLALVALTGLQCMQDLVVAPPHVKHVFTVLPALDTLPIVGPKGDPVSFPFTVTLTADGKPVRFSVAVAVLQGASVVEADSAGRLLVKGRGEALLQVRPRNVELPDTLADTVSLVGVVPRIGLDTLHKVDTLASLHDTLVLKAVALTLRGDTIGGVRIPWTQVSGQAAVTLLRPDTGQVRADSEGTAVFRASVDRVDTTRTVVVRQRPAKIALSADTLVFHVGGQVKAATAQVQDARSNPIAGATATWTSPDTTVLKLQGPGLLEARNDGTVPVTVSFTRDGVTATRSLIAVVRRAHVSVLSGDHQTGIVTGLLAAPLVVQLADALGAVAEPNVAITFHVSGGGAHFGAPTDTTVTDTTVMTDAQGRASVTPRLGHASGVATFTASGPGLASPPASFTATGAPAPASQVAFQTPPTTRTAGTTFTPAIQVVLRDTLGNVATTSTKDVTLSFSPGTNPGGAVLLGTTTVTSSNGVATFSDIRIRKAGTGYQLTAAVTGLPATTSASFDIAAGPPATIAVTPAGASLQADHAQVFTADVRDSVGNVASGAGVRWASLNPPAVTIDSLSGAALAHWAGQFAISATAGSLTAYALVTARTVAGGTVNLWAATPSGVTAQLDGVWGSATSDVFAVGRGGTILHYNGTAWSSMSGAVVGDTLRGVWGSSASDVFAVGRSGRVLHFAGSGSWTAMTGIDPADHLFAVWGSSPRDVFAAGVSSGGVGVVYRYDGTAWSKMTVPAAGSLRGLWGASAGDVWATGAGGIILHYDGASWTTAVAERGDRDGWSIWGGAADAVFATANTLPGGQLVIRRYDGTNWTETSTTIAAFRSGIWGNDPAEVYVGTDSSGPFVRYDGTTWATMCGARGTAVYGIWGAADGTVWTVGDSGVVYRGYRSASVTVAPVTVGLAAIGRTRQLTATVRDASNNVLGGVPVTWSSSSPAVATVDGTGLVTAVATGSATVTATAQGGASAGSTVGVTPIAVSLDLTPRSATLAATGGTHDFVAVAQDSTGHRVLGRQPVWTALIPGVAAVATVNDTTARVTAAGAGQTVVRADLDNLSTSALVTASATGLQPVNVWQVVRPAPDTALATANFFGAWAGSDSSVVVGGNPRSYRFDGSAWHEITELRGSAIFRAAGPSPARLWAVGGAGALWAFDGTSWTSTTSGTSNTLANLWAASERDVFAAGANATMLHYDGTAWTAMTMPGSGTAPYSGLWGFSSSDVWVTGAADALLHWDGTSWSVVGLSGGWQGLWGSAPNDLFAVGNAGVIAHYNGTAWSSMSSPTLENLRRVWGSSPTDVYAAGSNGTILRYDGASWTVMPTYQTGRLVNGMFGTPRGTVWAVGGGGGPALVLRGYRGGSVTASPTSAALHSLGATATLTATVRDATSESLADIPLRWTSTAPSVARVDSLTGVVTAVANGSATVRATAAGGAYADVAVTVQQVSRTLSISPAAVVLAGPGATQGFTVTAQDSLGNAMPSPSLTWTSPNPTVATVNAAGVVSAVGTGQLVVTTTDGGAIASALVTVGVPATAPVNLWAARSTNVTATLLGVWGASPSDLFGVGSGGAIVHSDGSTWSPMTSGSTNALYAAWGTAHGDVFAVGVSGTILHYDGTAWTAMSSGTSQTLFSVWGTSHANVYAVGATGTLLHYDGTSWSAVTTGTTATLRAVWGTSASDVFVAGTGGAVLHFDGTNWGPMGSGTTAPLYGLWGVSASDVYAISSTGALFHYNGSTWSAVGPNPGVTTRAVTGTSGSDLYAVGAGISWWNGSAWTPMASGTPATLYGAWVSGSSQLYLAGGAGTVLRGLRAATVELTAPGWTTTAQGTQQQLTATAKDGSGAVVTGAAFAWTTSNPAVATVDGAGLLTAVDTGSTNVTATAAGGATASIAVSVVTLGNTVKVTPAGGVLSGVGATQSLAVEVRDAGGNVVPSPTVTWTSLDPSVATVDASGLVTAVGVGQARIVATSGALSGYALLTVSVPALQPVNVWAPMASGTTEILHDVWGTSPSDVWVAGENTALALHFDGSQWRTALSGIAGVSQYYGMSVGGTSANDVLVGTDVALLARFDGTAWTTLTPPAEYGSGYVTALWAASPRETYIGISSTYGGSAGGVARYNQGTWTRVQGVTSIGRLWGVAPGDLFVAGSTGTLWRCVNGTCTGAATPSGNNAVRGLWGAGATSVFAVGGGTGYAITYDGATWTQLAGAPAVTLNGVTGSSPTDVYAVGAGGAIARYDGAAWSTPVSGTTANLNQAWTSPAGDLFVVGDGGTILHGVRGGTVVVSTPSTSAIGIGASRQLTGTAYAGVTPLPGVPFTWTSSDTSVARVGSTTGLVTGVAAGTATITATAAGGASNTLLVTVSSSAATVASVTVTPANPTLTGYGATQQLTATARDASNDVIAGVSFTWSSGNTGVATVGTSTGLVTAVHTGTAIVTATAAGGKTGTVTVTVAPGATSTVTVSPAGAALSGVGSTQALTAQVRDPNGDLVPSPTATWASLDTHIATVDPGTGVVTAVAPGQVVVTATSGGGTGTALVTVTAPVGAPVNVWVPMNTGTATYANAVWGTSATDVWAVSSVSVLHYDGAAWATTTTPAASTLFGIWGTSPGDVFAVGYVGTVVHFDGSAWTAMTSGTTQNLMDVWGSSHSDVFAVGYGGTILHFDGTAWSPMASGTTNLLYAVWGTSRTDVWAAGASGTLLHYDGTTWSATSSGTTMTFYDLWGTAPGDVFAVGSGNLVLHWNGSAWSSTTLSVSQQTMDVWGTSDADVYAVGSLGTVLRNDGSTWRTAGAGTAATLQGSWGAGLGDVYLAVGSVAGGTSAVFRGVRGATLSVDASAPWTVTAAGNQKQLAATARDAGNALLAGVPFTWISRNNRVATVNAAGLVTADSTGTTYIVVSAPGGLADSVAVTVTLVANTVTLVPGSATLGAGSSQTLFAQVRDALGNLVVSPTVRYASLNPAVATVDSLTGLVTAVEAGQAVITATSSGIVGTMLMTVTKAAATPVNLWATAPSGTTMALNGVWGASPSNLFAVGVSGTVLRWNGSAWSPMASGTTQSLQDVWGTSAADVYAVGNGGTILHYDGTSWAPMISGTTQSLLGVWGASRSDIFAVGNNGTILRYDGTTWTMMASGTAVALYAVWGTSRANVFAVGAGGTVVHYDGSAWSVTTGVGGTVTLQDVWGVSPTEVFAVTGSSYQLVRYDGSSWSVWTPAPSGYGLWGTTSSGIYVVGSSGGLSRWDGAAWTAMTSGTGQTLNEVWTTSASDVTVVGNAGTILRGIRGATVSVAGGSWTVTPQGNQLQATAEARDALNAVVTGVPFTWQSTNPAVATVNTSGLVTAVALGSADIIATAPGGLADTLSVTVTVVANSVQLTPVGFTLSGVGSSQTLAVEVRDGTGAVVPSPTVAWASSNPAVATVDGSGVVTAVAAGQTSIAATSGAVTAYATVTVSVPGVAPANLWTPASAPAASYLYGIWGSSPSDVYASSNSNLLYHYNGSAWTSVTTGATGALRGIWGTSGADVFAVGSAGNIVHYNGSAWTVMPSGSTQSFVGVWGSSPADVFVVGSNGAILHYDGTAWSAMASGTTQQLAAVWGTSRADVYAAGYNGTFLHYDGNAWSAMPGAQTWWYPQGIWGTSSSNVYVVGGGIYHWNGSTWTDLGVSIPNTMYAVRGTSPSDVTAVGYGGGFVRYNGSTWTSGSSGTLPTMYGLWSAGDGDLFAAGYLGSTGMIARGVRGATVTLTAGSWTLSGQGAQQQLTAVARDASNAVVAGVPFTWTSRSLGVATVNGSGLVTAVSLGTSWVVATALGGATDSTLVTVTLVANSVTLSPLGAAASGVGGTATFTVTVRDGTGNLVPNPSVSWTSLNPSVATVLKLDSTHAQVTAVSAGQATIAAASGGVTSYALFTVAAAGSTAINLWAQPSLGTSNDVNGVWGASPTDVFAVAGGGTILHYDGSAWSPMASGSTMYLYNVWGASGTDVFVVGSSGAILHYNGTAWSTMTSGSYQWLADVWGSAGNDVFAVGGGGTILHYDGSAWSPMSSGTSSTLQAVWGTSKSDVWTVGYDGVILHYDGTAWTAVPGWSGWYFYDLQGTSPTNVYAVGGNGMLRFDGSTWSQVSGGQWAQGIAALAPTESYLVQSTSVVTYNGSTFSSINTPRYLSKVWGSSSGSVYAVGQQGTLLRGVRGGTLQATAGSWSVGAQGNQLQVTATARDQASNVVEGPVLTWRSTNPSVATVDGTGLVTAVSAGGANIIVTALGGPADTVPVTVTLVANQVTVSPAGATVTVGGATRALSVVVRDASGNPVPSPSVTWSSSNPGVATVSASGVVTAVSAGQTTITAAYGSLSGTALMTVTAAVPAAVNLWAPALAPAGGSNLQIYGLWTSSASDVFAVGSSGTVYRFNGTTWNTTSNAGGSYQELEGVWGTSSSDVFAVGGGGAILHFNGSSWSQMPSGTTAYLYSVWGSSGKDVYAAGDYGTLLHSDGTAWSVVPVGVSNWYEPRIWGSSARDVYVQSGNGALHFDGTSWSAVPGLPSGYGLWGTSATDVYGASYYFYRFNGTTWSQMSGGSGGWAYGLWGTSPSEIFAVSSGGQLSTWNGSTWAPFATISDRDLWTVSGTSTGDVYAVGSNWNGINAGVIMRGVRGATVTVTPTSPTITGLGTTQQLTATGYSGATPVPGVAFTWTSSNQAVATVSATGLVTAVAAGTATITATAPGGASGGTTVTVSP